jgi:glutamyl-tRNA synthetase
MNTKNKVRVRFAPSPTGGLHLGGIRTVLFNYLFAKQHGGDFILRIEDTDQTRFVAGAEDYILECLNWCGLIPDEGPVTGGPYAPYRQSERKENYRRYAEQLVAQGNAYYAFDTPEALEAMRERLKAAGNHAPQYNHTVRMEMNNSLSLGETATKALLDKGTPHVIRIKVDSGETVAFTDMIRGEVSFATDGVDDKVLLKADGMPTYHLAVVVDDYLMKISHAFRGEEWLPSAPVHILLWKYLGWEAEMPEWAHLPLILKPDGNGKLSKRDGDRLGFPVYAMNWKDPNTGELTTGFRERGFLPEAFVNMLAMLGWNDGTGQEIFSMEELVEKFSITRVHKGGAKFDFEKAKWFNHQYIQKADPVLLRNALKVILNEQSVKASDEKIDGVISLVKERCHFVNELWDNGHFFFQSPETYDLPSVQPKWTAEKKVFFEAWIEKLADGTLRDASTQEGLFKELAAEKGIKPGELLAPFRIMLVGAKHGPGVFDISVVIGVPETIVRIQKALAIF